MYNVHFDKTANVVIEAVHKEIKAYIRNRAALEPPNSPQQHSNSRLYTGWSSLPPSKGLCKSIVLDLCKYDRPFSSKES